MMIEFSIPCPPGRDRYWQHQFTSNLVNGEGHARNHIWRPIGGNILIRTEADTAFSAISVPVLIPSVGAVIRIDAKVTTKAKVPGKGGIYSWSRNAGYEKSYSVMIGRLERSGLQVGDIDAEIISVPINKPGHHFILSEWHVRGRATVTDSVLLADAMKNGVGPDRAFGCGLMQIKEIIRA